VNLSPIDWAIIVVAVIGLRFVSLSTRRYMRGVSDFLSANRVAGRYLLTIASQMGGTGVVSFIALFEMFYGAGLAPNWWSTMVVPAYTIVALSGWIYYRFRETHASPTLRRIKSPTASGGKPSILAASRASSTLGGLKAM
jgi:solute:Na+ symporter, SSS family